MNLTRTLITLGAMAATGLTAGIVTARLAGHYTDKRIDELDRWLSGRVDQAETNRATADAELGARLTDAGIPYARQPDRPPVRWNDPDADPLADVKRAVESSADSFLGKRRRPGIIEE